jgi:hypothetical protein
MKLLLSFAGILLLALSAGTAPLRLVDSNGCRSKFPDPPESTTKVSISGPEDIVAMTHVIEQPDSPVEILAIDLKDSFVSVVNERYTEQLRCTARIHNRSDQPIRGFDLAVRVSSISASIGAGGGGLLNRKENLAPGQEMEIQGCGGQGSGGAPGNHVLILAFIGAVGTEDSTYLPSLRYPNDLGVISLR